MKDSQRMAGATCEGCGKPSGGHLGRVSQRDLGSADKWHARCYRNRQARVIDRQRADGREYGVTCGACGLEPMMGLTWSGARDMAETHNRLHRKIDP